MLQECGMQSCGISILNETKQTKRNKQMKHKLFLSVLCNAPCFCLQLRFCCQFVSWRVQLFLWRWLVEGFLQNHGDLFFSRMSACLSIVFDFESALHTAGRAQWTHENSFFLYGLVTVCLCFVKRDGQFFVHVLFKSRIQILLHVGTCVSTVRKNPVCWKHLEFWETLLFS